MNGEKDTVVAGTTPAGTARSAKRQWRTPTVTVMPITETKNDVGVDLDASLALES